jgi:putative proteasome-type protease
MTYCVGVLLETGIVLLSDTRTNAGFDNIASYKKMFVFEEPGERVIALMTAGSLSVTQTLVARLRDAVDDPEHSTVKSVLAAPTMLEAANIVGDALSEVTASIAEKLGRMNQTASASLILAGQRKGGGLRMFLIYPEGNYIEATAETPFLQIGEHKYGKPILDRVVTMDMGIADAKKALLLSMDSTLRSNLSVGMPLDLAVISKDEYRVGQTRRYESGDPAFAAMSEAWSRVLREGFSRIEA